jgi:hypothetical protein
MSVNVLFNANRLLSAFVICYCIPLFFCRHEFVSVNVLFNANHFELMHVLQLHEDDNGGGNENAGPIGTKETTSSSGHGMLDGTVPCMREDPSDELVVVDQASEEVTYDDRHTP